MWLSIDDELLPKRAQEAREGKLPGAGPRERFWLNIDTGATIFLGPVRETDYSLHRDQIRVYCLPPADGDRAIDVTSALTGKEWRYTDSQMNDTRFEIVKASLSAAVTKILTPPR